MERRLENLKKLFVIFFLIATLILETTNIFAMDNESDMTSDDVYIGKIIDGFDGEKEIVVEIIGDDSFVTATLKTTPYGTTHNHQMYQYGNSVYKGITYQGRNGAVCYREVYEVLFRCSICGYGELRTVYITKYHFFLSGKCQKCGLEKEH